MPQLTDYDNFVDDDTPIVVSSPGKLFLAGEYAVTTPQYSAIIAPVPYVLTVELTPSQDNTIYSTQTNETMEWIRHCQAVAPLGDNVYPLITKTIEITESYIAQNGHTLKNFELYITTELDDTTHNKKYGLGSSGAVTIATIKALLQYYRIEATPLLAYQLAVITHLTLESNGSFGDLAVSAYEQLLFYTKPDTQWILNQLEIHSLVSVVAQEWPSLHIEPLPYPKDGTFLIGWTGSPASSHQLVLDIAHLKPTKQYAQFLQSSQQTVLQCKDAILRNDHTQLKNALQRNQTLLESLSPCIDTKQLKQLRDIAHAHDAIGKISGAGGGDCGFAFVTDPNMRIAISRDWALAGICPLFTLGDSCHD